MKSEIRVVPRILILTEGETEKIYLGHLRQRDTNYSIRVKSYGGSGALKMVRACSTEFRNSSMDRRNGDLAVCVMDVDRNSGEEQYLLPAP